MKSKKGNFFITLLLFLIFLAILFEGIIIAVAYFGADEVSCNYLWCTFKTTRSNAHSISNVTQECFHNGVKVNCSDNITNEYIEKFLME